MVLHNNDRDGDELVVWQLVQLTNEQGVHIIALQEADLEDPRYVCIATPMTSERHWMIMLTSQPQTITEWAATIDRYQQIIDTGNDYISDTESYIHLYHNEPITVDAIISTVRRAMGEIAIAQNVFNDTTC